MIGTEVKSKHFERPRSNDVEDGGDDETGERINPVMKATVDGAKNEANTEGKEPDEDFSIPLPGTHQGHDGRGHVTAGEGCAACGAFQNPVRQAVKRPVLQMFGEARKGVSWTFDGEENKPEIAKKEGHQEGPEIALEFAITTTVVKDIRENDDHEVVEGIRKMKIFGNKDVIKNFAEPHDGRLGEDPAFPCPDDGIEVTVPHDAIKDGEFFVDKR